MWYEFIRDFGDFLGGISIGYAIGMGRTEDNPYMFGVIGGILFLTSIYFRFYGKKKNKQEILPNKQ